MAHLQSIYSTTSKEWKSNCVVQALIDLRRENEGGFRGLMQELALYNYNYPRSVWDYISQHED
jgi:hypothetical protein